jgi:hypothetical protein
MVERKQLKPAMRRKYEMAGFDTLLKQHSGQLNHWYRDLI